MSVAAEQFLANFHGDIELGHWYAYDAKVEKATNDRWATIWKVAAIASAIAFIALAGFVSIYVSLYAAEHLPAITIGIFFSLIPAGNVFKKFMEKSQTYAHKAKVDAEIIRNLNCNNGLPKDVKTDNANLKARYHYYIDLHNNLLKESTKPTTEVMIDGKPIKVNEKDYTIEKVDFSKTREVQILTLIAKNKNLQLSFFDAAAAIKIKAACCLQLMMNPDALVKPPINDHIQRIKLGYSERYALNDKNKDAFAKIKNKVYTANEISKMDITKLNSTIFG